MKLLANTVLARIVGGILRSAGIGARAICVIQDRQEGWRHLATCLAVRPRTTDEDEYIVWRINLESPGAFSGHYISEAQGGLQYAWERFAADVPKRILTEPGSRVGNEVLVKYESKKD